VTRESIRRAVVALEVAVSTLTVIPVGWLRPTSDRSGIGDSETRLADSRWAYPVVGLLLGILLTGISSSLIRSGASVSVASFLVLGLWVAVSGGLHLDGLADTADGLFLPGSPERRLAVLRDPHVGSFGVIALVLVLLGKYVCLNNLGDPARTRAVLEAAILGRLLILCSAGRSSYPRPSGTGRSIVEATRPSDANTAALVAIVTGLLVGGPRGLVAAIVSIGLCLGVASLANRRLGGVTGDILGAVVEITELSVLVVWAIHP
jgi:adenosylcobinamide-GDP ribazoletransferase